MLKCEYQIYIHQAFEECLFVHLSVITVLHYIICVYLHSKLSELYLIFAIYSNYQQVLQMAYFAQSRPHNKFLMYFPFSSTSSIIYIS